MPVPGYTAMLYLKKKIQQCCFKHIFVILPRLLIWAQTLTLTQTWQEDLSVC